MYGTIAAGDRTAVEETCAIVLEDHALSLTARQLSINWGERFFHAMERTTADGFRTLHDIEKTTLDETLTTLGVTTDVAPYAQRLVDYWRTPPLHRDALPFFERIGLPVCIVSNADHDDLVAALARHNLNVTAVVSSEMARAYKPDPRIFEVALQETGWNRDSVLHVGDSLHSDIGGARAAGIRGVWLNRTTRIHDVGDPDTHPPDYQVPDLLAVCRLLGQY
jgi:2-haloacid dehalogenase/putative hydrolase of the HAD superfamily